MDRLIAIVTRSERATVGPWETLRYEVQRYGTEGYAWVLAKVIPGRHEANIIKVCHEDWPPTQADADFIAHAREDIPWLIERYQELDNWASRMPDAGFTSDDPRWDWWHLRPQLGR